MKYKDEFQNNKIAQKLALAISKTAGGKPITLMEVCGTHTMAIHRFGIKELLPEKMKLLSGPGCPVCVTANEDIDAAIAFAGRNDCILTTFGDMFKVPGSTSSLAKEKAEGRNVVIVYSPLDALGVAEKNPDKKTVFFGIGFETTAPTVAAVITEAKKRNLKNFFVYSAFKIIPNALRALLDTPELKLDGLICPGHLSAVTGSRIYEFIPEEFRIPCVITGFEALDILQGILMLAKQAAEGRAEVEIQYKRSVPPEGNPLAMKLLNEVFEATNSVWRGIGLIPGSGLKIRKEFESFDAGKNIPVNIEESRENPGCICGFVLRGLKIPTECKLYGKICTPENPVGACMVSSEGTCAAYYKYVGI